MKNEQQTSHKHFETLWNRMAEEDRDKIQKLRETDTRRECLETLQRVKFYTECTYAEIFQILLALGKPTTLEDFSFLFRPIVVSNTEDRQDC